MWYDKNEIMVVMDVVVAVMVLILMAVVSGGIDVAVECQVSPGCYLHDSKRYNL